VLVSVITPTWQRHDLLTTRCIPSVERQTGVAVEHIVVSDGPDPELTRIMADTFPEVRFFELPEHSEDRHWGNPARLYGLDRAEGGYIAYLDDDDAYRPNHCELHSQVLDLDPSIGLTISRMRSYQAGNEVEIGHGVPGMGNLGTPMVVHRRELLEIASWGYASATEDWELVAAWLNSGITYASIDAETIDVWPSAFR
jgi:glycosyltransferase involved in cell wall biosynthesis